MAAPQPPPRVARPQTTLPAAEETRDAESFPARRFEKGRSQVPCLQTWGLDGVAPRLAATTRGPSPVGPLSPLRMGCEVFPIGALGLQIQRAKGFAPYPDPTEKGGKEAWAQARMGSLPGPPSSSAWLGLLDLLYLFS